MARTTTSRRRSARIASRGRRMRGVIGIPRHFGEVVIGLAKATARRPRYTLHMVTRPTAH